LTDAGLLLSLALLGFLASLVFVLMFARRLGILGARTVRQMQQHFLEPRIDRDRRRKAWFRAPVACESVNREDYKPWNLSLAITKSAKAQLDGIASSTIPLSVLLYNTDPPTYKVNKRRSVPAIMFLRQVNDLESFPSYYENLPKGIIGTWHNHLNDAKLKDHDRRIFEMIDKLVGPLVHVIAAKGRWQIYSAFDSPVFSRDRTEAGNQEANRNGKLA